jgi:hypothetical protein
MLAALRRERLALACLVVAGLIGVAAIFDHEAKQRRIDRAQVDAYYCRTQGVRCGGASWHRIEDRWQARQLAYEIAVLGLSGAGAARLGYRLVLWFGRSRGL